MPVLVLGSAALYADTRPGSDMVAHIFAVKDQLEAKKRQELFIERLAFLEPTDGQNNMRNTVYFNHDEIPFFSLRRTSTKDLERRYPIRM